MSPSTASHSKLSPSAPATQASSTSRSSCSHAASSTSSFSGWRAGAAFCEGKSRTGSLRKLRPRGRRCLRQRLPLGRNFLKEPVLDFPSQKAAPARQPEKDEVELAAWEQLDRDVEEACVAGAEGESFECEAVLGDMV